MPKVVIDYSNTIIYKITCKDPLITDVYVGHTTNFIQRKHTHKLTCNNQKSPIYNLKLYNIIRANGNWSNWDMSIIKTYNCKDLIEAIEKETIHILLLDPTLNCDNNPVSSTTKPVVARFIKDAENLECHSCDYICSTKYNFDRHLSTKKHKMIHLDTMSKKTSKPINIFECFCGKKYKYSQGLSKHKLTCIQKQTKQTNSDFNFDKNLFLELLQQNNELQKSLIELSKTLQINNNTTNNNSIINNKTFNIQVYLNDDCKDALNMSEFVSSIQVQIQDLEETGRLGYVEGVSRIINKNLNNLEVTKRPIQCSDLKRETLYIKDDDIWVKEGEEKDKLKMAIKQIAKKNIQQIGNWVNAHPNCRDSDSRKNDTYLNIVSNAMPGITKEEQCSNINKIVTNVAKKVTIDK